MKIKILIPIYNDWQSVFKLLENIDLHISELSEDISVLIINDASIELKPEFVLNLNNIKSVSIINMKKNTGHAKCNAVGLKYIIENENIDYVIPMDGDGEDRPEEIKLLINKAKEYPNTVITANRVKRSEGLIFRASYLIHKFITFLFTGHSVKFGNYTCLPKSIIAQMVGEAATWSSFSGSLCKVTKDRKFIPSIRGTRYFGPSKMSYFNLLKHSLLIISIFKTTLLVRSLIFLIIYFFLISQHISIITLIPVFLLFILSFSVLTLSSHQNLSEFNDSLENIDNIETLK